MIKRLFGKRSVSSAGGIFADLAFNTCLAMTLITFVLIQRTDLTSEALADANQQVDGMKHTITTAQQTILDLEGDKRGLEIIIEELRNPKPASVVIAIDASASMGNWIKRLRMAVWCLAEAIPEVTEFELGIVVYREGIVAEFPLQMIRTSQADGGASRAQLRRFLNGIEDKGGYAAVELAVDRALSMTHPVADKRQAFCLLADVGPGETEGSDPSDAMRILSKLRDWGNLSDERRIVSLYASDKDDEHRPFFEQIGELPNGDFCDESTAVLRTIFRATFKRD